MSRPIRLETFCLGQTDDDPKQVRMLENIIGQRETVTVLREELKSSLLPPALLFHGPVYSGKLSAALEVARVLLCEENRGEWNCACSSCEQNRQLVHPGVLLLGPRYFSFEIPASADVFRRNPKVESQYLFIRSVRKLLRRFDPILWEDDGSRIKSALTAIVELQQSLESLVPRRELSAVKNLEKEVERIVSLCGDLAAYLPAENIPINQIRAMCQWCHLSNPARRKVAILENADKMQEGSRNAILKILEEPPRNTYLVLLTTRKGLLIQTVLSRLRSYPFHERSVGEQIDVLSKIFKEEGAYSNLREYFLAWKGINPSELKEIAKRFMNMILAGEDDIGALAEEMKDNLKGRPAVEYLESFGEEILILLRSQLYRATLDYGQAEQRSAAEPGSAGLGLDSIERWANLLQSRLRQMSVMNLNPSLVLESLFYGMKEAI